MKRSTKRLRLRARDQMQDHLGVGGRLHHRAFAHQLAAQRQAVGQVAVVADGEAAAVELGEQRLHVAQDGFAGGRIAHMADRGGAGQAVDHLAAGEVVADEAHAALGMEALAVEGDDAGGFLAAVLERVQAERGDGGGVGMAEDAEHAAFLAQPVGVEIERRRGRSAASIAWSLVVSWRRSTGACRCGRTAGSRSMRTEPVTSGELASERWPGVASGVSARRPSGAS